MKNFITITIAIIVFIILIVLAKNHYFSDEVFIYTFGFLVIVGINDVIKEIIEWYELLIKDVTKG